MEMNSSSVTAKTTHKLVMIVDDSSIDNFVNQKMISLNNFSEKIQAFTKAKKAIEFLSELDNPNTLQEEIPSVIFLDLNMPEVSGFEFLKHYENFSPKIKDYCSVIILTSSVNPADLALSFSNSDILTFLNKPLLKPNFELIELLRNKKLMAVS